MQKRLLLKLFSLNLVLILSILLVITPITIDVILAQDVATACLDAERQAESDVDSTTWFAIGCLLGLVGWLIGMVSETSPPAAQLMGKSPEYVAVYTDCYKKKAKSIKTSKALIGCLVGTGVTTLLYVLLIAAAADEAN